MATDPGDVDTAGTEAYYQSLDELIIGACVRFGSDRSYESLRSMGPGGVRSAILNLIWIKYGNYRHGTLNLAAEYRAMPLHASGPIITAKAQRQLMKKRYDVSMQAILTLPEKTDIDTLQVLVGICKDTMDLWETDHFESYEMRKRQFSMAHESVRLQALLLEIYQDVEWATANGVRVADEIKTLVDREVKRILEGSQSLQSRMRKTLQTMLEVYGSDGLDAMPTPSLAEHLSGARDILQYQP